jgi:hypothetical protein
VPAIALQAALRSPHRRLFVLGVVANTQLRALQPSSARLRRQCCLHHTSRERGAKESVALCVENKVVH